ncbi:CapA family protein [Butyrivibrio fibrisolvens]|uniref:CapA family protein n=1 Tax=Butyrivibrio fibrisolvens TaxID=831 RepID=UPI0003B63AF7|nr:CapA family protein [Butyrivibrio fibrisolvens]
MKKGTFFRIIISIIFIIVTLLSAMFIIPNSKLTIPESIVFNSKSASVFNMNASLQNGHFELSNEGGAVVWKSDSSWKVQDFLICDIDNDSQDEILLLTWKKGSFGRHLPFWVDKNDTETGQHIYIYEKREQNADKDGFLRASWMSSSLQDIINSWSFDNKTKLRVTYESGQVQYFSWIGWGLKAYELPSSKVTFTAVGDTIAHKQIYTYGAMYENNNYDFLYDNVKEKISDADLSAVVQETPFAEDKDFYNATEDDIKSTSQESKIKEQINRLYSEYPRFASPQGIASSQEAAGFDIIACATNHMMDQGIEGIDRTYYAYKDDTNVIGILPSDRQESENYIVISKNGITIALFDYTYGINDLGIPSGYSNCINILSDEDKVKKDLETARQEADAVIVFVHWGEEYKRDITDYQKKWTDVFYESGVNVVIGSHPHVLEPYELIQREGGQQMLVYYSLGNFVSGQNEIERILGGMATFTINKTVTQDGMTITLTDYELEPIVTHQEKEGIYTAYFLRDYTDSLASMHRLNPSIAGLWVLYDDETKITID